MIKGLLKNGYRCDRMKTEMRQKLHGLLCTIAILLIAYNINIDGIYESIVSIQGKSLCDVAKLSFSFSYLFMFAFALSF